MKTIIFVCHGNICRSVAAEYICKDMLNRQQRGHLYNVISRATSTEEIGNDIYPPMKYTLNKYDIPFDRHYAKQITKEEVDNADYIFYMDNNNLRNLERMFGENEKFTSITHYTFGIYDIDDPWYTDLFDEVVSELEQCIDDILIAIK